MQCEEPQLLKYEEPQLIEIKISQFVRGDDGDETSGGLPPGPQGDNPFNIYN